MTDKKTQAGIALGSVFGLIHLIWISAVGSGLGQQFWNTVEGAHFLSSDYIVTAFDPVTALTGLIGAIISGFVIAWIFVYVYSKTGKKLD